MFNPKVSKPIGKLENQQVFLGWIIAAEKLIVAFKQQRIRKVVDITHGVPPGPSAQAVVDTVIPVNQSQVVDKRAIQVPARPGRTFPSSLPYQLWIYSPLTSKFAPKWRLASATAADQECCPASSHSPDWPERPSSRS